VAELNDAYIAKMEDVLATYERPGSAAQIPHGIVQSGDGLPGLSG
jgi:hypothetical protein